MKQIRELVGELRAAKAALREAEAAPEARQTLGASAEDRAILEAARAKVRRLRAIADEARERLQRARGF